MKALKKQGTLGGTHNQDFPTDAAAKHTGGEAVQVHLAGLQLCWGAADRPGQPLPQAHGGEAVQVHLGRLHLCRDAPARVPQLPREPVGRREGGIGRVLDLTHGWV